MLSEALPYYFMIFLNGQFQRTMVLTLYNNIISRGRKIPLTQNNEAQVPVPIVEHVQIMVLACTHIRNHNFRSSIYTPAISQKFLFDVILIYNQFPSICDQIRERIHAALECLTNKFVDKPILDNLESVVFGMFLQYM